MCTTTKVGEKEIGILIRTTSITHRGRLHKKSPCSAALVLECAWRARAGVVKACNEEVQRIVGCWICGIIDTFPKYDPSQESTTTIMYMAIQILSSTASPRAMLLPACIGPLSQPQFWAFLRLCRCVLISFR